MSQEMTNTVRLKIRKILGILLNIQLEDIKTACYIIIIIKEP